MLEYALRQERIKYARAANGLEGKLNILEDQKDMSKVENLPERPIIQRAQGHQSILVKFLEEIGFEDVFSTADVADIKDLFTKATSSLSKNQELLKTVSRIEEEVKRKIFQEENKKETLEEQFKQIRGSDHQKNPSDGKDSEASGERSNEAENQEEVLSDASFDSVQRDDQSSTIIEADYANKMSPINLKHEFNVHLDSVRGVQFVGSLDCMASVSEDCTVKLWDVKLMHKNMEDGFGEGIEFKGDPYYTLRGHTGPLFRVTGSKINDQIIYTAGNEGIVRIWKVPDVEDVDIFGQGLDNNDFCLGILNGHNSEPIWDLKHHPTLPFLLSMGADNSL
eukprot:CAMPEP_0197011160 /NCGR_PEP_ID=MMETSP1380-20130617/57389_1 /TAXON_ID=5936 /ORGANISM="Euplotes crassus, Strain CT5" /LENGTH=336 /DNA_ID=CAMNT_0042433641 /DNA_START=1 /DNA_END=1011 /DNA_ORIENTATION=-